MQPLAVCEIWCGKGQASNWKQNGLPGSHITDPYLWLQILSASLRTLCQETRSFSPELFEEVPEYQVAGQNLRHCSSQRCRRDEHSHTAYESTAQMGGPCDQDVCIHLPTDNFSVISQIYLTCIAYVESD